MGLIRCLLDERAAGQAALGATGRVAGDAPARQDPRGRQNLRASILKFKDNRLVV